MKRFLSFSLVVILLLSVFLLAACKENESSSDPITMYVSLGNGQLYFETIQKNIKDTLGLDVKFIYNGVEDTTSCLNLMLANQDAPADIIFSGSAFPENSLFASCINFQSETNLANYFSHSILEDVTCSDGGIYQLPITSRLIGITYNETLLKELGADVPNTFEEMLALKKKCDENGILFAMSGGAATGHGFNWLFHLMGSEWISSLEGSEWLDKFLSGETDVDAFEKASLYFKEYAEAGLFGEIITSSWNTAGKASQQRALFIYDLTNSTYAYDGLQYTSEGRIKGATYDEEGNLVYSENKEGAFVLVNQTWTLFDGTNETHLSLTRYDIPGAVVLHDTYKSMPWISKDGTTNNYTYYHSCYVSLNRQLLENGQEERLKNCIAILEYLTSESAASCYVDQYLDGYTCLTNVTIRDDALYANYKDQIAHGYLQPWYYNQFDSNTILTVGELINRYLSGDTSVSFSDIMDQLSLSVQTYIDSQKDDTGIQVLGTVTETLSYYDLARLEAVCGAINLQEVLTDSGIKEEITVSLLPYIQNLEEFPLWNRIAVVNTKLYAGSFTQSSIGTLTVNAAKSPSAVYLTGEEINHLLSTGYVPVDTATGEELGRFSFAMMTKNNQSIQEDKLYLVAININHLPGDLYTLLQSENRILLTSQSNVNPATGLLSDGIISFFKTHTTISKDSIKW